MATPVDSSKSGNVYFNDPESGAEMARLLNQDRLVTKGMGGLFAERSNDFSGIQRILDVACGPGGWVQEVAFEHPEIEVVGFDISRAMIDYANAQAQVQGLDNARFLVMDMLKPLDFPNGSFDLVNARFINFLPAAAWPKLLQEFQRITRPGGFIRLTESEWWYFTNSPALENSECHDHTCSQSTRKFFSQRTIYWRLAYVGTLSARCGLCQHQICVTCDRFLCRNRSSSRLSPRCSNCLQIVPALYHPHGSGHTRGDEPGL